MQTILPGAHAQELTTNSDLLKKPQYHKVKEIVRKLQGNNMIVNFAGNCIGAADVMQHLLSHAGIPCKIVECQACLIRNDGTTQDYLFIGYDNKQFTGQLDTHVVVITTDDCPMLIDLSLGHVLPKDQPYIVEMLSRAADPEVIAEYNIANINITYSVKKSIKLPNVHQKNLLDRILSEQNMAKTVATLKTFVICAVSLGLVNFLLNVILIVLRLYNVTWVD